MFYRQKRSARAILGSAASTLVIGALLQAAVVTTASAQAAAEEETEVEEVVVTGTFLRGTPETAVIPVEGVNLEELRDQGSPSNQDLIKGLSEIGSVAGEANRANAFAIGAASVNLRGIGSNRTVVVFNGRRFPEQYSFSVGRFNNINQIPNAAIGRVEVLKDGGATTYGADAVGGVVNYITRRNLDGVEFQAGYRYIDGSDGDYDASLSFGKVFDNFNIMGVLGYLKRSELDLMERDWAMQPYLRNPGSWTAIGNPGSFIFLADDPLVATSTYGQGSTATARALSPGYFNYGAITRAQTTTSLRYGGDRQMGPTGIMRDPNCEALGGFAGWSAASGGALCYTPAGWIQNLVEEQETWQFYGEANYEFSPRFRVHGEFMYYGLDIPRIPLDNGGVGPNVFPLATNNIATQAVGAAVNANAFFVPGTNPAVRALLDSMTNSNGTNAFGDPLSATSQYNMILNNGRVALPQGLWRPFHIGGNPIYGETDFQHNFSDQYRYTLELAGELGKFAGGSWDWSFAYTLNTLDYTLEWQDIPVDRMQAALNGLGGASCTGSTPGANGCQYFNPFTSALAANMFTGAVNPGYVGTGTYTGYTAGQGLQNNPDLVRWMYMPQNMHRESDYAIFDLILRGELDYHLWTEDPIQVAFGGQYRELHEISDLSDFSDEFTVPCATPSLTTCTTRNGPSMYRRGVFVSGFTRDYDRRYPVMSAFGETRIPVTDAFSVQVSGRYEKFFSDQDASDNEVFVWQGAARWQALPWLALRATAGETFSQVNPPAPNDPITTTGATIATQFGGGNYTSVNYANTAVKPETGFNYNVGLVFEVGDVTATLDYYNIKIEDLIRAQSAAQIINALLVPGTTSTLNCTSPLITDSQDLLGGNPFVSLGAPCVQGTTTIGNVTTGGLPGGTVRFFGTQGQQTALVNGGSLETSGIDAGVTWRGSDILGGDLSLSTDFSWVLTYDQSPYTVAGVDVAAGYSGIGLFNELTGRNGQHIAEYRGSLGINYRKGRHNFNWSTRVVSSFLNDDNTDYNPTVATNANVGQSNGMISSGFCSATLVSPPIPANSGTADFGAPGPVGAIGTGVGYDPCQSAIIATGAKIPATFTSDFTYRVDLPSDITVSLNVQNVFDQDPQFSRDLINYDAYTGSPLGRTFKVTFLKKWQ